MRRCDSPGNGSAESKARFLETAGHDRVEKRLRAANRERRGSGPTKLKNEPLEMVFIRGPIIERAGPGVKVLAEYAGKPALVQRDQIMAATFHPELTDDTTVHQHFLGLVASATSQSAGNPKTQSWKKTRRHTPVHA